MAKIILISPPYIDLYGKLNKGAGRYFPLGLGYIAAYLRYFGHHDVQMYEPEAQGLSYQYLAKIINKNNPDVIGLTCSTPNFYRAMELAKIGKENSKAKIVLGGVHASAMPEYIMETHSDHIDCIVCGEGEITMLELVNAYQSNSSIETIKGIFHKKDNKVVCSGQRPFIDDLDKMPYPARDLIPQKLFMPNMWNARYKNSITILTSRGCPFNCNFCASRIVSGTKYRMHSAEYVLGEMEMLKKDYHARQLLINDDTFTVNRERLERICNGMIDRHLDLKWFCFAHINTIDKNMLELMKKAGCFNIVFGLESADEEILKKMGKSLNPEKAIEIINTANGIGLKTQATYIFGTTDETKKQMEKTIEYSKKVNATLVFYNMFVPYPGTKDFQYYFSSIPLNKMEWENFVAVGEKCVLNKGELSPKEIENLISSAYLSYYINIKRIFNILKNIRTMYEFFNYLKAGFGLMHQMIIWRKRKR